LRGKNISIMEEGKEKGVQVFGVTIKRRSLYTTIGRRTCRPSPKKKREEERYFAAGGDECLEKKVMVTKILSKKRRRHDLGYRKYKGIHST